MSPKNRDERIRRAEQQATPPRDAKRDMQYQFALRFAQDHPSLHSASASPAQRAQAEHEAVGILMHEMQRRMDAGGKTDSDTARALSGLLEFQEEEDWE